jgi:hypothetical protein
VMSNDDAAESGIPLAKAIEDVRAELLTAV